MYIVNVPHSSMGEGLLYSKSFGGWSTMGEGLLWHRHFNRKWNRNCLLLARTCVHPRIFLRCPCCLSFIFLYCVFVLCFVLFHFCLFVFVFCLVYPMLPLSLNCPFWIGTLFFSNVYVNKLNRPNPPLAVHVYFPHVCKYKGY